MEIEWSIRAGKKPFQNAVFLHEVELTIEGVKFYGAPWVPDLERHAFFADDDRLKKAWEKIPEDVDVLITHTPPAGILDVSRRGKSLGCPHLSKRLRMLNPKLHCFGHVQASAGLQTLGDTTYVNATMANSSFEVVRAPVQFDVSLE